MPHIQIDATPIASTKPRWYWQREGDRYLSLPMSALTDRRIKHEALRVLMALALHADTTNGTCFPGRDTIAKLTGIHPSNVSKATKTLEELGWLTKEHRKGRSVNYRLKDPYTQPESKVANASRTPVETDEAISQ